MISAKPPKTAYTSLNDVGKFNMMWNVSLILIPVFVSLFLLHVFFGDQGWLTSLLASLVAFGNLFILYKLRKYKAVAFFSVFVGIVICQTSIFIMTDSHMIAVVIWCLLIGVFAFFLLGSIVGGVVMTLNLTGLSLFLFVGDVNQIQLKGIQLEDIDYQLVLNVYLVGLAFSFIVHKMITNIRQVNTKYEQQISRNEILLKEIHHRVKNNLQIISSLLKLQAAEADDKRVEGHFREAINRIRSMALIHEKMYTNDDLAKIDIQTYLIALVQDIMETLQSNTNIEVNVNSEIDKIDIESIVPVSLIFNELITNSIKHGFLGKRSGVIDVRIEHVDHTILFKYFDDGQWKEGSSSNSFGLEMISSLTEQLNGTYSRESLDGTHYLFLFPEDQLVANDNA